MSVNKFISSDMLQEVTMPIETVTTTSETFELGGVKAPKETSVVGGTYPSCLAKWEEYSKLVKFASAEAMEQAKKEYMTKCMTTSTPTSGTSAIVEPVEILSGSTTTTTPTTSTTTTSNMPNLGAFLSSLTGGGSGAGATEETAEAPKTKKPFPYWILIAVAVGGYLVFRKK